MQPQYADPDNDHLINRQHSFRNKQTNNFNENYSLVVPRLSPTHRQPLNAEKQLSVRSISTHKHSKHSKMSMLTSYDHERERQHLAQSAQTKYEAIERILKNQNHNLKKQNELLLSEIQRLKTSNRKYKDSCLSQRIELQALKEECEAQKKRADEMKEIIMNRLISLESKALGNSEGLSQQEREDLLQALSLSQSIQRIEP